MHCSVALQLSDAVTHGSKTYATAEEEAQKWHTEYEPFDWTSNDIPQAAWTFLESQGKLLTVYPCTQV